MMFECIDKIYPSVSIDTVTGSICNFTDNIGGLPLKSCSSLITGYQEGSGTPSPDNVRPLHDFSSATLTDNGNTHLFTFGQSIYQGSIDWLRGVVTGTWRVYDLGSLTWAYSSQYDRYESNGISNIYPRGARRLEFNCEIYQVISDGRPLPNVPDFSIYTGNTEALTYLYIHDSTFSGDSSALTTYVTGKYVALPLQNSITISLGGINLLTQEGQNNIFADCGDTTVEYIKIV